MPPRLNPRCRTALALLSALLLLAALQPPTSLAWGSKGHRIIALVASRRLTSAARAQVKNLLAGNRGGHTLTAISTWADKIRFEARPDTSRWHFVDIPLGASTYVPARDCAYVPDKGDCLIAALERFQNVLADRRASTAKRAEALKFLTHLIGDLHQPLHCAERNGDRGGNDVEVTWFGHKWRGGRSYRWNLHSVWDDGLIDRTGLNVRDYASRLAHWLRARDVRALQRGRIRDWALETHAAAASAYTNADGKPLPASRARLGQAYYEARIPLVDQQLAKAGVRLAAVINNSLR